MEGVKTDSENKSHAKTPHRELEGASCLDSLIRESVDSGMAPILLARGLIRAADSFQTVTTILPFCRLDSMYRWASTMASSEKVRSMIGFSAPD